MKNYVLPLSVDTLSESDSCITNNKLIDIGSELKLNFNDNSSKLVSIKHCKIRQTIPKYNKIIIDITVALPDVIYTKLKTKNNSFDWTDYSLTSLKINETDYLSDYVCGE